MTKDILAQQLLLPEMKLLKVKRGPRGVDFVVKMTSPFEYCTQLRNQEHTRV